jgi:NTE family protein
MANESVRYVGPWSGNTVVPAAPPKTPKGRALALSGGGFRATLFHMGVVRRLYVLGVLDRIGFLSSVSGGSVLAALVALRWQRLLAAPGGERADLYEELIEQPIRKLVASDVRDRALHRVILRKATSPAIALAEILDEELYDHATMADLPGVATLRVAINSANLATGKRFHFTQDSIGDNSGYTATGVENVPVAVAVAASSAFPVGFAPYALTLEGPYGSWGASGDWTPHPVQPPGHWSLCDGGVYDDLGFEAASFWADALLLCNASDDLDSATPLAVSGGLGGAIGIAIRAISLIMARHSRLLLDSIIDGPLGKTSVIIDSRPRRAEKATTGYAPNDAALIAALRTDIDRFTDLEIDLLSSLGECVADAMLHNHGPSWVTDAWPLAPAPHTLTDDDRRALRDGQHNRVGAKLFEFWKT